jgi:hypothetical protein
MQTGYGEITRLPESGYNMEYMEMGQGAVAVGPTIESVGTAVRVNSHPVRRTPVNPYQELNLAYPAVERQIVDMNPDKQRWLNESNMLTGPPWKSGLVLQGPGFAQSYEKAQIQQAVGSDLMTSLPEPVNEPSKVINPPIYELYDDADEYRKQELAKETTMSALTIATAVGIAGFAVLCYSKKRRDYSYRMLKFN